MCRIQFEVVAVALTHGNQSVQVNNTCLDEYTYIWCIIWGRCDSRDGTSCDTTWHLEGISICFVQIYTYWQDNTLIVYREWSKHLGNINSTITNLFIYCVTTTRCSGLLEWIVVTSRVLHSNATHAKNSTRRGTCCPLRQRFLTN